MQVDSSGSAPELSYAVDYQVFAGNYYNLDFAGKGRLVVRPDGPTYVFSGKKRALFARKIVEQTFTADEIWNVVIEGKSIRFSTNTGKAGKQKRPFLFFCRTAEEAAAVTALMPTRVDADFTAAQEFEAKLKTMPQAATPWASVTNAIIALNLIVFVLMAGFLDAGWLETSNLRPYVLYGANNGGVTTDGEWWRLVTSMFMHFGLVHVGLNMWALFQVGHLLEKLLGRASYTLAYLGSGITGSLASIVWHGDKVWSAGASGAVFGVYGALLGYMVREKQGLPRTVYQPLMRSTLGFAGYNLVYGLAHPGIDNACHIGGLLGGFVLGWIIALPIDLEARARVAKHRWRVGLAAAAVLIAVGISAAPRFDYHLTDEIAWSDAMKEPVAKETELLKANESRMTQFRMGANASEYGKWLTSEMIPFFQGWEKSLASLKLAPGRLTAHRREWVIRILSMRVENYQHLAAGIRNHDSSAYANYQAEEMRIAAEIQKLAREK